MGLDEKNPQLIPKILANNIGISIKNVSCGEAHTIVVAENGSVWAAGDNKKGQLGTGNKDSLLKFGNIEFLKNVRIKKVSCGEHTAAISYDGNLYLWGTSVFGEYLNPTKIENIEGKVVDVCIGLSFGVALDELGKVWTWGTNTTGELGVGDFEPRAEPFCLTKLQSKTVTAIACGGSYAIALGVTHKLSNEKQSSFAMPLSSNINEEIKEGFQEEPKADLSEEEGNFKEQLQSIHDDQDDRGTPSVSDLGNAEVSSSVSQRDPNHHVNDLFNF